MTKPNIANTIFKLRRDAGYTQAQVSQKLNIQRQTYCNYENASRTPPLEIIVALAELYHVSIDYLVCGENSISGDSDLRSQPSPDDSEQELLNEFASLPESTKEEILAYMQFRKLYHG